MERTFLGFEEVAVLPQALQDLHYMLVMFNQAPGVDQDVVDVDQCKLVEELPEHLVHEVLECGGGIHKPIWLDPIFIVAGGCHKCSLPLIPSGIRMRLYALSRSNLVKRAAPWSCSKAAGTSGSGLQNFTVILIVSSVIVTRSQAFILLSHQEAARSSRGLGWMDIALL